MNPALYLVLVLLGTMMMVAGVLAALLGWLPAVPRRRDGHCRRCDRNAGRARVCTQQASAGGSAATTMTRPRYEHTQPGWLMRLTFAALALGLIMLAALPLPGLGRAPSWALLAGAALAIAVGWCFSSLTIRVRAMNCSCTSAAGGRASAVPLADLDAVEITRTTFIEGWGVHRTRRGWLYNVGGFDAVILRRRDGTAVLVGSDEAPRLKAAIERARGRV